MLYLNNYNSFNEDKDQTNIKAKDDSNNPVRSERLLSQAQRESSNLEVPNEGDIDVDKLPSMVFTDVVGSSEMWSKDAVTMMAQLKDHHNLVVTLSNKNNGWIVKTIGDAFMVYFEPGKDSLINALKFSKELILKENTYGLRIGICQGIMQEETYRIQKVNLKDFYGNPVNTASRMESKIADGAGVIAFTTEGKITEKDQRRINLEIGKISKVDLTKYDLKGAKAKRAFKIKVK